MEKPESERGDSAATGDDDAAPPPSPDRSPVSSLVDAASSRATAPPQPSGPHAASSAAAFDARATPDPDAIWSIVLAKFGRGRTGGSVDFAACAFVKPASGAGVVTGSGLATPRAVEKPESEPRDSAAAGADFPTPTPSSSLWKRRICIGSSTVSTTPTSCSTLLPRSPELHAARAAANPHFVDDVDKTSGEAGEYAEAAAGDTLPLPSPTPPPTPSRILGGTIGSGHLAAASSSPAPAQHAARARTFIKPDVHSSPSKDLSLPPPHCDGGIMIKGKEAANPDISNGMSVPSTSTLFPHRKVGWKEGHPTVTMAHSNAEEQWDALIAKWNRLKDQAWEFESEEGECMRLVDCITNQRRLLEDKEEELKRVAEEQQQKEDALLLERVLLRERRMKQEEEEASRARRINNPRLSRSNSSEGFMSGVGAAHYADHMIRVLAVNGTNARPDLFVPLLQNGQIPASAPVSTVIPPPSLTPVPATAKPKAEDDMWNKRQLGYIFYLGLAVGLVFLLRPLLPDGYDRFLLAGFATVWGLGSIGLPLGIFGTSRLEKNISRHIGRFISLCFSDMVIYAIYRLAVLTKDAHSAAKALPSPSPAPIPGLTLGLWELIFGGIAFFVTVGHVISWIMGYCTGGDRDLEPYDD